MRNALLSRLDSCPHPHHEVLCFPHAGGSASYFQRWAQQLPAGVALRALQLPLREERLDDDPISDMRMLISQLMEELANLPPRPRILFGHSMGATVAWELALAMQHSGNPVRKLFVSGQTPPDRQRQTQFHLASNQALITEVSRFSATSASVFEFPALRELVLGQLRHDYALIECWQPTSSMTLTSPITVLHGTEDSEVNEPEARRWANFTLNDFKLLNWPGDHFYLTTHWQAVLRCLMQELTPLPLDMP